MIGKLRCRSRARLSLSLSYHFLFSLLPPCEPFAEKVIENLEIPLFFFLAFSPNDLRGSPVASPRDDVVVQRGTAEADDDGGLARYRPPASPRRLPPRIPRDVQGAREIPARLELIVRYFYGYIETR